MSLAFGNLHFMRQEILADSLPLGIEELQQFG